jgi:hypothetical protein
MEKGTPTIGRSKGLRFRQSPKRRHAECVPSSFTPNAWAPAAPPWLRAVPLLRGPQAAAKPLQPQMPPRIASQALGEDEVIFNQGDSGNINQGDSGNSVFFIADGSVAVLIGGIVLWGAGAYRWLQRTARSWS